METGMKNRIISVKGSEVTVATRHEQDYISLTDMVRNFDGGSALIEQWLKTKDTVLFLGVWEQLNNPGFNSLEFDGIKNEASQVVERNFARRVGNGQHHPQHSSAPDRATH
jgi:hypothetical protein